MSAPRKSRKTTVTNPFQMMGTQFKDLDETRFMKGSIANKVAVARVKGRATHVPQPSPPASSDGSDVESFATCDDDDDVTVPFDATPSKPRPAPTQRFPPPKAVAQTVVAHERAKSSKNDRVLPQPTVKPSTGLMTPITEKKKVVRMFRTPSGSLVKKEVEITLKNTGISSDQRPLPAPNFGSRSPPASSQKETRRATPFSPATVKSEPLSDDEDYVHFPSPSKAPIKKDNSTAKVEEEEFNPFRVFQTAIPTSSKAKKSDPVSASAKLEPSTTGFDSRAPVKTEDRSNLGGLDIPRGKKLSYGLATPEATPTKEDTDQWSEVPFTKAESFVISGEDILSRASPDDPFQRKPSSGPFRTLSATPVPLLRLKTVTTNNNSFGEYVTDNGHALQWYQAFDLEGLVAETVAREVMQLEKNTLLKEVPQGRILNYDMGMGKTHVALSLIAESCSQIASLYKSRKLKRVRKPVLVIAEKSLQTQWVKHARDLFGLKAVIYDSNNQPMPKDADLIIVNIFLIRNQHKQKLEDEGNLAQKPRKTPFFETSYLYLIVDEFHQYSNPSTLSACALLNVKADHVLLLSGTPSQNKLEDLHVPLALLQHITKRKIFREIERTLRRAKNERALKPHHVVHNHNVHDHTLIDQTFITRRIFNGPNEAPSVVLPNRKNNIVTINLSKVERSIHTHMHSREQGFVRFLRCRQACLDPRILIDSGALELPTDDDEKESELVEDVTDDYDWVMADVDSNVDADIEKPPSYDSLAKDMLLEFKEEVLKDDYLPSKTVIAIQLLREMHKRGEKTLIFSNFTKLLLRLSDALDDHRIGHTFYHGLMDRGQRDKALSNLANEDDCRVMLVSIKAGGMGLNITAANNVIIMDPWWNPYVEEQAIARVYRIGQERDVNVYRLIAPNTVEDRIVETQNRKVKEIGAFMDRSALITKKRDALNFNM